MMTDVEWIAMRLDAFLQFAKNEGELREYVQKLVDDIRIS